MRLLRLRSLTKLGTNPIELETIGHQQRDLGKVLGDMCNQRFDPGRKLLLGQRLRQQFGAGQPQFLAGIGCRFRGLGRRQKTCLITRWFGPQAVDKWIAAHLGIVVAVPSYAQRLGERRADARDMSACVSACMSGCVGGLGLWQVSAMPTALRLSDGRKQR